MCVTAAELCSKHLNMVKTKFLKIFRRKSPVGTFTLCKQTGARRMRHVIIWIGCLLSTAVFAHEDHSKSTLRTLNVSATQSATAATIEMQVENFGSHAITINGFRSDLGVIQTKADWPITIPAQDQFAFENETALHLQADTGLPGIYVITVEINDQGLAPITIIPTPQ